MSRPKISRRVGLSVALLAVVPATGTLAQGEMPADCPMHAEHQRKTAAAAAVTAPAGATGHTGHAASVGNSSTASKSPYVGMMGREIAALSEEEIAALRTGSGHGLALPAEVNQYPGPRHLLDLASELALDAGDAQALTAIYERMHTGAVALGERVVAGERELDRLFADGRATSAEVSRLTADIARLRGELRATHLVAHVEAKALLTAYQIARYDQLRGYASPAGAP